MDPSDSSVRSFTMFSNLYSMDGHFGQMA